MPITKHILILIGLFAINVLSAQEVPWEFKRKTNDITIFTRQVADSPLKELKFTMKVDVPLQAIMALLLDIDTYQKWVYKCTHSSNVKEVNGLETFDYYQLDFPWPLADRDIYTYTVTSQDPITGVVISETRGRPDTGPIHEGYIRIRNHLNRWIITPVSHETTELVYYLKSDPAGDLPAWLINLVVDQGPLKTMKKFMQLVQDPKYMQGPKWITKR